MKRNWTRAVLTMAVASVLGTLLCGCAPVTNPNTVLAGTWSMVPTGATIDPPLTSMTLTFNSSGVLTQIVYTFEGLASITWSNPPSTAEVSGSDVSITVAQGAASMNFSGTLNSTQNVATGALQATIQSGNVNITIPQGPATMTKQQ